jgi:hypothetical protein
MADDASTKKQINEWLRKPFVAYQAHVEKQGRLFQMFNAYITERGGWVTSPPNQKGWVRFEAPSLSEIPIRLREKNIPLAYVGEGTRIVSSNVAMPVTIFETKLGWAMARVSAWDDPRDERPKPTLPAFRLPDIDAENERREAAARIVEIRTVRQGAEAWASLSKAASYDAWLLIGRACLVGRKIALARSGANRAIGNVYSRAFHAWAKEVGGFAGLTASTRSDAITLAENESAITAWRNGLPRRQRQRLINPQSVVSRWRAATQADGRSAQDLRRDALAGWRKFVSCLEMMPSADAGELWEMAYTQAAAHM